MSLAKFARQIGISPATARQWKRRGKIVERDGEFLLADSSTGAQVGDGSGVTGKVTSVTSDGVTVQRDNSVTERDIIIRLMTRVAALESDVAEFREWVNRLQHDFQKRLRSLEGRSGGRAFDDGEGPIWGA